MSTSHDRTAQRLGIEYPTGQVLSCPHFPDLRVRVTTSPSEHHFGRAEVCTAVGGNGAAGRGLLSFRFDRRQLASIVAGRPGSWRPVCDGDEVTFPAKTADRHRSSLVVLVCAPAGLFLVRNEELLAYCMAIT